MGNENRPKYVYCVVKNATLRKKDGSIVFSIPFSNQFRVLGDMGDGHLYGEAYKPEGKGYTKLRGYVNANGFTCHKVHDMANLFYRNITGCRIPTAIRYKGIASGWIDKDETVNVIAYVNGWMLTGKGWTKANWLQKEREIGDFESMRTLVYAVITQTVKDYRLIIRKMQGVGRFLPGEYVNAVGEIKMIRKWFHDGDYLKIFEDSVSGEERLDMLDKEMGVTEEWLNRVMSKRRI